MVSSMKSKRKSLYSFLLDISSCDSVLDYDITTYVVVTFKHGHKPTVKRLAHTIWTIDNSLFCILIVCPVHVRHYHL